ncbi:protein S100-P [Microcaecilia unicolor]|uniref:Protein S100-P n=1 Tax=Microcaecilia unicolor TaxID=1415580 RepID=A0A6P7XE29_9AMPH|nr:protein S100-P [Microcaecilia unicolor]
MSQLEIAMATIISVFGKYAGTEGSKKTLSKAELKTLVENELPGFLTTTTDKVTIDKLLKDLDENGDSEVDFKEFIMFVTVLTCICHEYFTEGAGK